MLVEGERWVEFYALISELFGVLDGVLADCEGVSLLTMSLVFAEEKKSPILTPGILIF